MKVVGTRGRLTSEQMQYQDNDIRQRSITPDTHKVRVMSSDLQDLDSQQLINAPLSVVQEQFGLEEQTVDYPYYVDAYSYDSHLTSRVLHFGINTHRQGLSDELQGLMEEEKAPSTSSKSKKSEAQILTEIDSQRQYLTSTEKDIVGKALEYLGNDFTKTVLIDIFVRGSGQQFRVEGNIPEVHTVVLYKQGDKYLLLDPSNTTFSYIIASINSSIVPCINEQLQIYKPLDNHRVGSHFYQWRDCVDIAVKLAFGFNANNEIIATKIVGNREIIDFNSLRNSSTIKDITNQKTLYEKIPSVTKEYPIRSKQSSDLSECAKTTLFLKILFSKFQNIEEKLEDIDPYRLKEKYLNKKHETLIVSKETTHQMFIEGLIDCKNYFQSELLLIESDPNYVENKEIELIGENYPSNY